MPVGVPSTDSAPVQGQGSCVEGFGWVLQQRSTPNPRPSTLNGVDDGRPTKASPPTTP